MRGLILCVRLAFPDDKLHARQQVRHRERELNVIGRLKLSPAQHPLHVLGPGGYEDDGRARAPFERLHEFDAVHRKVSRIGNDEVGAPRPQCFESIAALIVSMHAISDLLQKKPDRRFLCSYIRPEFPAAH